MYNIWLEDEEGDEHDPDDIPGLSQEMFFRRVERDATASFAGQCYDDYKDKMKYGG